MHRWNLHRWDLGSSGCVKAGACTPPRVNNKNGPNLCAKPVEGLGRPRELSVLGHAEAGRDSDVGAGHGVGLEADGPHTIFLHGP